MTESWKDIPEYAGHYQISAHGQVRSLARAVQHGDHTITVPERLVRFGYNTKGGHLYVRLFKDGAGRKEYVHRLVAAAFVPGIGVQVNHIDGDPQNNRADNLEWCTVSENRRHAVRMGLLKGKPRKLTTDDASWIRSWSADGFSAGAIARAFSVTPTLVGRILRGEIWRTAHA